MNHTELILEISKRTGIAPEDCDKVMKTFEDVIAGELSMKGWKNGMFDTAFKIMNSVKVKKDRKKCNGENN
ncbi:MAG: hypothetical protein LUF90_00465 [Rikenellaceae bacterium]|nr:hypothetical protein [Rikenellaceae bacterium]